MKMDLNYRILSIKQMPCF